MTTASPTERSLAASQLRHRINLSWMATTALLASMSLLFAWVHLNHWRETGRPTGLAFGAMELTLVGLFLARRRPLVVSRRPQDWAVALVGGYAPLMLRPAGGALLGLDLLWAAGEMIFTAAAVLCLLRLGRSFGVIAANRGVKHGGPYRVVRHPMYAAYQLAQVSYLLGSFSALNAIVLIIAACGQLARIHSEERVLCEDPSYRQYSQRVRFRLIPGVY